MASSISSIESLDKKHTLHGGPNGFGHRLWTLVASTHRPFRSRSTLPDGDAGFPGALTATCVYRMLEPATLRVELSAVSDKPTIVNLTQHSYFNLDGSPDILDHEVRSSSPTFIPLRMPISFPRARSAPSPERPTISVPRGPSAIRAGLPTTPISSPLASAVADGLAPVALVRSPVNGLTLVLFSTEPGVQFYDAAKLNCPVAGLGGARYGAHAGLCLEPQAFPDSPNRRHFTDCVLRPGDEYRHVSEFRFG